MINKEPNQHFGKVLLKGLAQGALGGYVVYQGKNFNRLIYKRRELGYSWPAKIINSAGVSIIENAALNRNFWEQWNLHIGFSRIELHTNEKFKVKYKIRPASLLFTLFTAWDRKLEWGYSLKGGNFIFSGRTYPWNRDIRHNAAALGNVIVINNLELQRDQFYTMMTHELIHALQYEDFNAVNSLIHRPVNNLRFSFEELDFLNSIIYPDVQMPVFAGIYLLEDQNVHSLNDYYENFFEDEARYFSTN